MSAHTPKPWNVVKGSGRVQAKDGVGVVYASTCRGIGEAEANAVLAAAAPDLLDALKRCEELLAGITDIRTDLAEFQNGYLKQAREAIAKAEGDS